MRASFAAGISASLILAQAFAIGEARADPAYKADAVVAFFIQADREPVVCIGTEYECPPMLIQRRFVLVKFPFNSAELSQRDKESLDEFAKALKDPRLSRRKFAIDGHSDASGAEQNNLDLSQKRASAVAAYLALFGVPVKATVGFGSAKPLVPNKFSPENRRVEARMYTSFR